MPSKLLKSYSHLIGLLMLILMVWPVVSLSWDKAGKMPWVPTGGRYPRMCSIPNQEAIGAHMLSQQPNKLLRACRGPQKWHHNAAWPQVAWGARSPGYASETSKWDKADSKMGNVVGICHCKKVKNLWHKEILEMCTSQPLVAISSIADYDTG